MYPRIPNNCDLPPTLFSIMNSIANFDSEEKTKIKDLALETHEKIFDFDYPLSSNISKEDFEVLILNKFIMRRIGFDTMTAFKIALNVKLNEIMPTYNKMFDMLEGWDLFNDGEITSRTQTTTNATTENNSATTVNNGSNNLTNISDRRFSNVPQNAITDVQDGTYVTEYNYDTDTTTSTNSDTTNAIGNKSSNDSGSITESITRTPSDKIKIYNDFIENKKNIYSMIFRDLDVLFYGLV
jgi:hypothetical protein